MGSEKARIYIEDESPIRGGVHTDGYEQFIRRVFTPANFTKKPAGMRRHLTQDDFQDDVDSTNPLPPVSSTTLLKLQELEYGGKDENPSLYSPLEVAHGLYGTVDLEEKPYQRYEVYQPKSSSEYYSVMNKSRKDTKQESTSKSKQVQFNPASQMTHPEGKEFVDNTTYRLSGGARRGTFNPNPNLVLIERGETAHSYPTFPTPYNYRIYGGSTRLAGSDFLVLAKGPEDPWVDKVDKLLAKAKKL